MAVKLPSGKPKNWPNSNEHELEGRPTRHIKINSTQEFSYVNNVVKTSKYEWYNFLPKFLMEEFNPRVKIANCYFLLVSCLQCIPIISNTNGKPTTLIPLSIVVFINAFFQIMEDRSRHRADKEANTSTTYRLNPDTAEFEELLWSDVCVGNIVMIKSYDLLPADILCLGVSDKEGSLNNGICYVETKSLDGETNLKIRTAMPSTYSTIRDGLSASKLKGNPGCNFVCVVGMLMSPNIFVHY
jgi:phospholipid-transporting ATPase